MCIRDSYWGSGAGIGGNGVWAYGNDTWVDGSSPNFGTIQIEEGTINAVGGERKNTNVGGGAGIGSGSCSSWGTLIELSLIHIYTLSFCNFKYHKWAIEYTL